MSLTRRAAVAAALVSMFPKLTDAKKFYRYRWDLSEPIIVENHLGPEYKAMVNRQVMSWRKGYKRFKFKTVHFPAGPCFAKRGAIIVCETDGFRDSRWGETRYDRFNRRIFGAQVVLRTRWIWEDTLCHEFGHALGLDHNDDPKSCMGPGSAIAPNHTDRQSIRRLYSKRGKKWPAHRN